jgi:hypothetical protein
MILDQIAMAGGPFDRNYKPSAKVVTPSIVIDPTLKEMLGLYEKFIKDNAPRFQDSDFDEFIRSTIESLPSDITCSTIQQFLSCSQSYESKNNYSVATGLFTSALIQRAHNGGNNFFLIDARFLKPIDYMCFQIEEERKDSLHVMIFGNLGHSCVNDCQGGTYYFENSYGWPGYGADHSSIYVRGNTGVLGACGNQDLTFHTPNPVLDHHLRSIGYKVTHYSPAEWNTLWAAAEKKIRDGLR